MSGTMSHSDHDSPVGPPSVHPHHDHPAHHHPPPGGSSGGDHSAHAHMVDDFRRRFGVSLVLTLPVLATSEMVRRFGVSLVLTLPALATSEMVPHAAAVRAELRRRGEGCRS